MRQKLDQRYQEIDQNLELDTQREIRPWWTYTQPQISDLITDERIVSALKAICGGDVCYATTLQVARNQVGHGKIKVLNHELPNGTGWHIDAARDGKVKYLTEDTYKMFKCGIYLQDNDEIYGGGIDVAPGCHTFPIKSKSVNQMFRAKTFRDLLAFTFRKLTVPIKAGDFLAFDYRIPHRSTLPKKIMRQATQQDLKEGTLKALNNARKKYVIYFDAGNQPSLQTFVDMMTRNIVRSLDNGTPYGDMNAAVAGLQLQESAALQEKMTQSGIRFSYFPTEVAERCRDVLAPQISG